MEALSNDHKSEGPDFLVIQTHLTTVYRAPINHIGADQPLKRDNPPVKPDLY
jgi:hypothetical protein